MRIILFFLYLNAVVLQLYSQRYPVPHIDNIPFPNYIQLLGFSEPIPDSSGKGIAGVCWVKFKPSKSGKPQSMTFSPNTSPDVERIIQRFFDSLDVRWPNKGYESSEMVDRWIVLPIEFEFLTSKGVNKIVIDPWDISQFFVAFDTFKEQHYLFLSTAYLRCSDYPNPQQKLFDSKKGRPEK